MRDDLALLVKELQDAFEKFAESKQRYLGAKVREDHRQQSA